MPQISVRGCEMPESPIRKLAPLAFDAKQRGIHVYHLNIGQPDLPTPQKALDAIRNIDRKILEYSPSQGYLSYRTKLVSYYAKYNINLTADDIIITSGGSEAVLFSFLACLKPGDEIIENRLSQVTFSALGQKAGTEEKYAWDPDCKKREAICARCRELAPEFEYEIGGTTSINAITPGMNKVFGMTHLLEELNVKKEDILYFGDMTQPGGNDYPVVQMGIDTITVRSHEDTAYALRGILGVL